MINGPFNEAVYTIIEGDLNGLKQLLEKHSDLVTQRSSSHHKAQLIHYLGANAIEDELQKSPANAPEIAELLISYGADPNSPCFAYGGESYILDLVASSVHPFLASTQVGLIEVLVKGGASIEGTKKNGSPLGLALGFGYTASAEKLAELGANVNNILYAAGLGLIEDIKSRQKDEAYNQYSCNDAEKVGAFTWPPPCLDDPRINAFIYAAFHNRIDVVQYFLEDDQDPNKATKMNQKALHFAAYMGHFEMVKLLVTSGAKPDAKELQWNSIPADWALNNGHNEVADYLQTV